MAFIITSIARSLLFTGTNPESSEEFLQLPLIKSPVDPKAYAWLRRKREPEKGLPGKIRRSHTVAQFESEHNDSKLAGRVFRKQEAASSLELFFDLFFVANLAVFTNNHAVANYIGFFSILWFSWFHTSIYDVRFYADSMFLRLAKMIQFGVMTAFVGLGPVYDSIQSHYTTRAFQGLGYVQMLLRFVLVFQYASVLYFVRGFHKTLVPLLLIMLTYIASGFAFLGTSLGGIQSMTEFNGGHYVYRWYIILGIEALMVIIISSIWRVLSFKHTHMHERVALLTLIVIGEDVLAGTTVSVWGIFGVVASTTVVIYFIYLIYFAIVDHRHMGSILQQLWLLAHYPLHIAIVLTVEGQSSLLRWVAMRSGSSWLNVRTEYLGLDPIVNMTQQTLVSTVKTLINDTDWYFHNYPLSDFYNPTTDISAIENATIGTPAYNTTVTKSLNNITANLEYFIYKNFYAEASEGALYSVKSAQAKVSVYNDAYGFIFEYYFISAGCLLICLAGMFLMGKKPIRKHDIFNATIRTLAGIALALISIDAFTEDASESSLRFQDFAWLISIVGLVYFGVLWIEGWVNVVAKWIESKKAQKRAGDEETGYREELKGQKGHQRTESDVDEQHERGNGYAHVRQDDDEHETGPARLKQGTDDHEQLRRI